MVRSAFGSAYSSYYYLPFTYTPLLPPIPTLPCTAAHAYLATIPAPSVILYSFLLLSSIFSSSRHPHLAHFSRFYLLPNIYCIYTYPTHIPFIIPAKHARAFCAQVWRPALVRVWRRHHTAVVPCALCWRVCLLPVFAYSPAAHTPRAVPNYSLRFSWFCMADERRRQACRARDARLLRDGCLPARWRARACLRRQT